jgi:hypothetical protein
MCSNLAVDGAQRTCVGGFLRRLYLSWGKITESARCEHNPFELPTRTPNLLVRGALIAVHDYQLENSVGSARIHGSLL